jgi:hypothetical protein
MILVLTEKHNDCGGTYSASQPINSRPFADKTLSESNQPFTSSLVLPRSMAPSHVPNDHHPLQGQNVYTDPSYEHLFPRVNQYGAPSWDQFNPSHSALLPQTSGAQSWHQNSISPQAFSSAGQPYTSVNHAYQTPPPYQYSPYHTNGPMNNYGRQANIDPTLGQEPIAVRQQQQSPYPQVMRSATPQGQPTVTPQALQQSGASLPSARPTASTFQVS